MPSFPAQRAGYSYGYHEDCNSFRYFDVPTPGSPNDSTNAYVGFVEDPVVSIPRGFYGNPVEVAVIPSEASSEIYYTTDGSVPSPETGIPYSVPIQVTETLVLRTVAYREGLAPSLAETHTYLIGESPEIRSLPVMSLATNSENLYGPAGILGISGGTYENGPWEPVLLGDYHNPSQRGRLWERPVSVEYIEPAENSGFQVDCGVRVHGSDFSRPRYKVDSKFSFRLYFRSEYGPSFIEYPLIPVSRVRKLTKLVLRGGHNDDKNPFIKDELVRRLFADCGHVSSQGTFVNLFLNGEYKGYYNPVERLDQDFFQEAIGSEEEWDVIRQESVVADGDDEEWNDLLSLIKFRDLSIPENYAEVTGRLDVVNFVDYLLVNIYGATGDWPTNNWTAARPRIPDGKFGFHIWDAEASFGSFGNNWTTNTILTSLEEGSSEIPRIYRALVANPDFRNLFAVRFRAQFYENGGLTDSNVMAHYQSMRRVMRTVIPIMETTIPATWVPRRRGEVITHLFFAGLLDRVDMPSTTRPSFIPPPVRLPRPIPGNPDLLGDGRIDARDLIEFEEQRRGSHSP